jgi:hypothetical protein
VLSSQSLFSILRGAARALRDPRRLVALTRQSEPDRQAGFEREAVELLGGAPRCVPIEHLLDSTGDMLSAFTFLDDTSTVLDLLVLRALVKRYGANTMFEIGTFRGEAALAVAGAGARVVTLSLSDSALTQRGAADSWVGAHRTVSAGHPAITHLLGDSRVVDISPYRGWADILFVDGDHSRAAVEADTRRFWDVRSPRVGAVVWHDAFSSPLVPRWEVIAGIAAGVPKACHAQLVQVSNTLCVAWLPDGESLPTVERSYVPRTAFSVIVTPLPDWRSDKSTMSAPQRAIPLDRDCVPPSPPAVRSPS